MDQFDQAGTSGVQGRAERPDRTARLLFTREESARALGMSLSYFQCHVQLARRELIGVWERARSRRELRPGSGPDCAAFDIRQMEHRIGRHLRFQGEKSDQRTRARFDLLMMLPLRLSSAEPCA